MILAKIGKGGPNTINGITVDNQNGPEVDILLDLTCVIHCQDDDCTVLTGGPGAYCKKCELKIHTSHGVIKGDHQER